MFVSDSSKFNQLRDIFKTEISRVRKKWQVKTDITAKFNTT